MSLPVTLRTKLTGDAGVAALVGTRVYWRNLPQEPTYPAITLETIGGDPDNTINATQVLHWARVRINAWGKTYGAAYELAAAIETALNMTTTTVLRSINALGKRDFYEEAIYAYYVTQDYSIAYNTA